MRVLGIDTSTNACTVALMEDNKLISVMSLNDKKTHSQKIMVLIEALFDNVSFTLDDIDCIAVGIGPGSFTGLRIGVSTAKALSHTRNIPMVEVSSLEALSNIGFKNVCAVMDARRDTVYTAIYGDKPLKETQISISDLDEILSSYDEIYVVGDRESRLKLKQADHIRFVPEYLNVLSAASICELSISKNKKSYHDIHVDYIKLTKAERDLND